MLLLAWIAAAAEPVLGPDGWTRLGPLPPGRDDPRGEVVFDLATCAVEVGRVDLVAGPDRPAVRLARAWLDGRWRWLDDWRVEEGRLRRPGRAPVPYRPGAPVDGEWLTLDAAGRVIGRRGGGRSVEIERDAEGAFTGMRDGARWVRLEVEGGEQVGRAWDGRTVRYRREAGRLLGFSDAHGVRTTYAYDGERLAELRFSDESRVGLEPGRTTGVGGAWTCRRDGDRVTLREGGGGAWTVTWLDDGERVADPGGATVRTLRDGGRLVGWTDPRGGVTRIARDDAGRVVEVTDATAARWGLAWGPAGLAAVVLPTGGRWTVDRAVDGRVTGVVDPLGRRTTWTVDAAGRPTGRTRADGATTTLRRDDRGLVVRIAEAVGGRVDIRRDEAGRVARVIDAGGAEWTVGRDEAGRVVRVTDPAGGAWAVAWDRVGRPAGVDDPTGRRVRARRGDDGRLGAVEVAQGVAWDLLRTAGGALSGVRDPLGRLWGLAPSTAGRPGELRRPDGSVIGLERDAAGEIVGVGGLGLERDPLGRPRALRLGDRVLRAWVRDAAGRVVEARSPAGLLVVGRDADGAVARVRAGAVDLRVERDPAGRVRSVEGARRVTLARDRAGRLVGLDDGDGALAVDRDLRGLVGRLRLGDREWRLRRDGVGRLLGVEVADAWSLGVDRDRAGRPVLVRFPDGSLARLVHGPDAVEVELVDNRSQPVARVGWSWDATGALASVAAEAVWRLRRDPLGLLVAAEAADGAWSWAPGRIEGPGGAEIELDLAGRPRAGRLGAGSPPAWGVARERITWVVGADGAVEEVVGDAGRVRVEHDDLGRLSAFVGPTGRIEVEWDGLGRLLRVGSDRLVGWDGLLALGAAPRAVVPGVAIGRPGGGLLLDPRGVPILATLLGAPGVTPGGLPLAAATGEAAVGGRYTPFVGGPAIGATAALDPVTGQPLGPDLRLPHQAVPWTAEGWDPPWPDPDAGDRGGAWDDGAWAPVGPWADPLALLVAAGELPDGGPRGRRAPGLPWLPEAWAVTVPAPVPDPEAEPVEEEGVVAWVLDRARWPVAEVDPDALARVLLGGEPTGEGWPPGAAPPGPFTRTGR